MTRKWSNPDLPGALHFVTGNVVNRVPIFKDESCCLSFFEVLGTLVREWPCKLIAYVLMPDHFHLIVNPQDGKIRGFGGSLKSLAARRIIELTNDKRFELDEADINGSIHQVWQESFKALPLWSAWMIWQKINYIHANPVRARLVASAKDYRWSSFRAFYSDSGEPLPVSHDWWWPDDDQKLSKAVRALGWSPFGKRSM